MFRVRAFPSSDKEKIMSNLHIVSVRENPAYTETAIRYFQKHWASEDSTTRQELLRRNQAIYEEYASGVRMEELAEKHFLSVKSIQRIIRQQKNEQNP